MMLTTLQTVLLLIAIVYIQNSCSQSCTVPGPCHLQCIGEDACKSAILNCYGGYPCTISCNGKASCIDAIIFGNTATDVTVICDGEDACKPTTINCGFGKCLLDCIPNNNICHGILVNTNIAKSFQCFNQCPNDILQQVYTINPTLSPSMNPTKTPTNNPTNNPSAKKPSISPTNTPSISPTNAPSISPTNIPSISPTNIPSISPTNMPSISPTDTPSISPTNIPSISPTKLPTNTPSTNPTQSPSEMPTNIPSISPTNIPSLFPSNNPTLSPLTKIPTLDPTYTPTYTPTNHPTTEQPLSTSVDPTNAPTIKKTNTNCLETDINHEIIVLTSNTTDLALTDKSIISYGIIVTITFDYKLSFYDTANILEIIHDIFNKLIVNIVPSSCIYSDTFDIESITKDNMKLINASIFVCSHQQQKQLLSVLSTNNIICQIINSIESQIGLQIPLNSTILQIHTISIYNESIPTSSPSLDINIKSDIDNTESNNYYGHHGHKMETILFVIVGTLAATSLIIACAIFILNSNKIRKHVKRHKNLSTNPITNLTNLEHHLSETIESPTQKASTVDINQNNNDDDNDNDNDIVNDEDYIHYETVDAPLPVAAAPRIIDGTIDETVTETYCGDNASLWRTDIKQRSQSNIIIGGNINEDSMHYVDHLNDLIGDDIDETPNGSKTFELPRYAIV